MNFTHLHLHTQYSLLDGVCKIDELMEQVKKIGQNSVAITDHGVMYGVIEFYKSAKKHGVKPIIGCEVYVAPRSLNDKVHGVDSVNNHLVLLCENNIGYNNLLKIVSKAWIDGFYSKPRIDKQFLASHHEGLIALSACLAGEIPRALLRDDYESAKETALWYKETFGEKNFFIEIQDHSLREQKIILPKLVKLANETRIGLVATNDVHYIKKQDSKVQEVLICIQTNKTLKEGSGFEFATDEFYLKSSSEMESVFQNHPSAITNTTLISDRCNVEIEFGNIILPHFNTPKEEDHFVFMKRLCGKGLIKRYKNVPPSYQQRLDYELEVIKNMGYVDYFLIVYDFIKYAKFKGIPVGPGRGSGAGSISAYCLGITDIDPMKYNLLFERFLNPERITMPDFDIDFCFERRNEVIEYVIDKYGPEHVAQIVTFGTMAARAAIRDVGRVMGMPYNEVDAVAKLIPSELHVTIDKALSASPELKSKYESGQAKTLIDIAKQVEGTPRHCSTHAAGVVITREPVSTYVALSKNDDSIVTQYTMTALEELGLLKMDFLGLRTLTVIDYAQKMIKEQNSNFSIKNIDLEDKAVFKMLSSGYTDCLFQLESAGMKRAISMLKPEHLEDIIALISLYRPGPMDSIPKYIKNKNNPNIIKYQTPKLKKILDVTYGCIVYQEQVMEIFRELGGYSYGRADIVRRAMAKKKHDVMEKERTAFIYGEHGENGCVGCIKNGVDEAVANEIFQQMTSFASYAFNKSHAAAYASIAYQTAYLKCHYPCQFLAAILTCFQDNSEKVIMYIGECKRLKVDVLPPSVNSSNVGFTVDNNSIRFGMSAIKNIGKGFIKELIKEREFNGKYTSFYNFCKRMHTKEFNRRALESLIKSGALDGLGTNRRQMLQMSETVVMDLETSRRHNIEGQMGFFDVENQNSSSYEPTPPSVEEMPEDKMLEMEKEVTGLYLSAHPLQKYSQIAKNFKATPNALIINGAKENSKFFSDGNKINVLGIISNVTKKVTRKNQVMAFVTVEDLTGSIEVVVFSQIFVINQDIIKPSSIVFIDGKISVSEDQKPKIICNTVVDAKSILSVVPNRTLNENKTKSTSTSPPKNGLYLRFENECCKEIEAVKTLISSFKGSVPVYFYYKSTKKYLLAPYSLWVEYNVHLENELKQILGSENIVMKN